MRTGLMLLLAAAGVVGCDPLGPSDLDRLGDMRARWADVRPASYTYTLTRGCFCFVEAIGPVRIQVDGDSVVSRTFVESGAPVTQFQELWPSMEGLFDLVEEALRDADEVEIRYDPDRGVPLRVSVDWITEAIDDEVSWTVTDLQL